MKILHITNWYPSLIHPYRALWIKKLIDSLAPYCEQDIVHFEIYRGDYGIKSGHHGDGAKFIFVYLPFEVWRIYELISFAFLFWLSLKNRFFRNYDIINFHIVYPTCTYLHLIRRFIHAKVLFTEHWSGYHFNFNIQKPTKRGRIQRIFHHNTPIVAVSEALVNDIKNFSQASFPNYVVPNVVDTRWFKPFPGIKSAKKQHFLMISQWKWPKDPLTVLHAWQKVILKYPELSLSIAGYGELYTDIQKLVNELDLHGHVVLSGRLSAEQVAREMNDALGLIHCSGYETFSVVCAESLCCGTPVIASRVGGITEYVHTGNGILVSENNPEAFYGAIVSFLKHKDAFKREKIAADAIEKFSEKKVGEQYFAVLKEIIYS